MGNETLQAQLMLASLSEAQVTLLGEAVRMGGRACKPVHRGRWGIAGRKQTVDALIKRELAERIEDWAVLTDKGVRVLREIHVANGVKDDAAQARQDAQVADMLAPVATPTEVAQAAAVAFYAVATSDDVEVAWHAGPSYQAALDTLRQACELAYPDLAFSSIMDGISDNWGGSLSESIECWQAAYPPSAETNELPGDAERAWDAENAAMEGAQVEAEQRAEVEFETMLARLGMDMDDYAECRDQLAMERAGCSACDPDDVNAAIPCPDHASVEAWVTHLATAPVMRLDMTVSDPSPVPVKLAMEGMPFLLVLASDPSAVVFVNTILVDKFGEEFTVMGARVSDAGTRVLIGRYASGGVGTAPYMRFPGLTWMTIPSVPWRPAGHCENRPLAPVAGVTTVSPWKASSSKRSKISGGKRGWRK